MQEHAESRQLDCPENPRNFQNPGNSAKSPDSLPELRPIRRNIKPAIPVEQLPEEKTNFSDRSKKSQKVNPGFKTSPDQRSYKKSRKKLKLKKNVIIFLAVCLLAGISVPAVRAVHKIQTAENSEIFQEEVPSETPEVPADFVSVESESGTEPESEPESEATAPVFEINPELPMIAITYDDGPAVDLSDRILDTLEEYHAHATFFLVGNNITEDTEKILKREVALGCEIGNHTLSHKNLEKLELEDAVSQLSECDDKIYQCTGVRASLVRPPYGAYNDAIRETDKRMFIHWSLDTSDWKRENPDEIFDIVMEYIDDGDIVLMHDIHEQSVEASEKLIPALIAQGYQLVTVSELIQYRNLQTEDGMVLFNVHPDGAFFNSLYGTVCDYELRKEIVSYDEELHHQSTESTEAGNPEDDSPE